MSYAARIFDGIVVEVVHLPEGAALADAFHPDLGFVLAAQETRVGMTYADGLFGPIPSPEPPTSGELIDYARGRRWLVEIGGITIAGVPVATDDRSKMMIIGARMAAEAVPSWSTIWQGADGAAYPLDAAAMIAISNAVQAHVNGTFSTLASVLADIESGDITTREEIDSAFGG